MQNWQEGNLVKDMIPRWCWIGNFRILNEFANSYLLDFYVMQSS
jgi:hypothetical protein